MLYSNIRSLQVSRCFLDVVSHYFQVHSEIVLQNKRRSQCTCTAMVQCGDTLTAVGWIPCYFIGLRVPKIAMYAL